MKRFFTLCFLTLLTGLIFSNTGKAQNIYWGAGEGFTTNSTNIAQTSSIIAPGGADFNALTLDTTGSGTWILYNAYISTSGACTYGAYHIRLPKQIQPMWISTPDLAFGVNTVSFANAANSAGKVFTVQYTTGHYADNDTTSVAGATWTTFFHAKIATACGDTTLTLNQLSARRIRWYIDSTVAYQTDLDSILIASVNAIVPVTFGGINAVASNGQVKINWSILTSGNTSEYLVERSSNGKDFSPIGTLDANGASNYSWIDAAPLSGIGFYKVEAVDVSGATNFSSVVKASTTDNSAASITVAPNPVTNGQFTLGLNNLAAGAYTLSIYSSAGQEVFSTGVANTGGNYSQPITLSSVPAKGIYSVRISNGATSFTKNIVVE